MNTVPCFTLKLTAFAIYFTKPYFDATLAHTYTQYCTDDKSQILALSVTSSSWSKAFWDTSCSPGSLSSIPTIWFLKHTQCFSKEKERAGRNICEVFLSPVHDFSVCDVFVWQTLSACNWASCIETDCSSLSQPHRRVRTTWTTRREGGKVWQKLYDLNQSYYS